MRILSFCLLFCLSVFAGQSVAQDCCETATDFGSLALNDAFKKEHAEPLPLNYAPQRGEMVSFHTLDGVDGQAFYVPSDQPTSRVLLIFHEWWGLNDYIKREAARWQELLGNVDVYALDLYDGKVAADRETAATLSAGLDKKRGENLVKGLLSHVGIDKLIGTLGWCMGGSWSFTAARLAGNQAAGCVMYYGVPEKDEKLVKQVETDVLFILAGQDKHITEEMVRDFGTKVEAAGQSFSMHRFDAGHAFANPSNPVYNRAATLQAEALSLRFLKDKLSIE